MGFISKLRGWWRSVSAVVGGKLHSAPSWSGGVSPSPSSAGENARAKFSQEEFRNMLIDALDDPAVARAVANRLALPTFPIKGGTCPNVTTSAAVTTGYLPYFDSGAGCTVKDSIVFEDATNSRIGIGRTNPQQKLDVYQAGGSTRIQVFADQSLSPGFRIQQNTRQAIDLYNPVDSDDFYVSGF